MSNEEYIAKIKTLNININGRTDNRNLPGAMIRSTSGDTRFATMLPEGAAECKSQREELIAKAHEDVEARTAKTEHKHYDWCPRTGEYNRKK